MRLGMFCVLSRSFVLHLVYLYEFCGLTCLCRSSSVRVIGEAVKVGLPPPWTKASVNYQAKDVDQFALQQHCSTRQNRSTLQEKPQQNNRALQSFLPCPVQPEHSSVRIGPSRFSLCAGSYIHPHSRCPVPTTYNTQRHTHQTRSAKACLCHCHRRCRALPTGEHSAPLSPMLRQGCSTTWRCAMRIRRGELLAGSSASGWLSLGRLPTLGDR